MAAALAALVLAGVAAGAHPSRGGFVEVNLDGDRRREIVRWFANVAFDHSSAETTVRLWDACGDAEREHLLVRLRAEARPDTILAVNADGVTRRRELFVRLCSSFGRRSTYARLFRLDRDGRCPKPRLLFAYPRATPIAPDPNTKLATSEVELGEFAPRRGLEILVRLTYVDMFQPKTPIVVEAYYRYDARTKRYVRYRLVTTPA